MNYSTQPLAAPPAEKQALKLIEEFKNYQIDNSYNELTEDLESLTKNLYEILGDSYSENILNALFQIVKLALDETQRILKHEGIPLEESDHTGRRKLYLEIGDPYQREGGKYFQIRFKIKSDQFFYEKDLTNAQLIFLNKDGFEIYRHYVGNVKKYSTTTGNFVMSENDFQDCLSSIRLVSDQD